MMKCDTKALKGNFGKSSQNLFVDGILKNTKGVWRAGNESVHGENYKRVTTLLQVIADSVSCSLKPTYTVNAQGVMRLIPVILSPFAANLSLAMGKNGLKTLKVAITIPATKVKSAKNGRRKSTKKR